MLTSVFAQAHWRKSSHSHGGGGACVMVAYLPGAAGVKDSKLGSASPVLPFASSAWSAFLRDVKTGKHDVR
ncbi:DUF397 domain-containing protein [Saccharopolyspora sp. ASAGF58]|uniref:DUF397 domain-containing protein n=1 Tax=Saccharopolyspora sp. ASAGF58 TaxID=2719023 RepID=UPI00143FF30E|nr:DUF397 domain-containing protein [Saccharopolyspora sp. ASAGF58]QIZ35972.1 DUF397 domain-containing protein [Saccharopolyspora sp. ASAGF58]